MEKRYTTNVLLFIIIVSVCISGTPVNAQNNFSLSWFMLRDDNTFRRQTEYDELINTAVFRAGRTYTGNKFLLQCYYNAHLSVSNNFNELNNHSHQAGALYRLVRENYIIDGGIYTKVRRNRARYVYYNTDSYNVSFLLRFEPDFTNSYAFGMNMLKNKFTEFSDINNVTYRFFGRYQHFFQSRWSFASEIGLGAKNYPNQTVIVNYGTAPEMYQTSRTREEPVNALMLSAFTNIGKSLSRQMGMNIKLGGQRFIGGPIRCYINGIYYFTENDLFDDPYAYEELFFSLNFTRQFDVDFQGKIGVEIHDKNYKGTPALNEQGNYLGMTRQDLRREYFFLLSKKFDTGWKIPDSIELFMRLLIRDNSSNDLYFAFTDHIAILGFTIGN